MPLMGTLYLVRHGQASLGAADYDQLSELGARQCERLGQWFAGHGVRFDAVWRGTLKRHAQSLAAIEAGLQRTHDAVQVHPALDEYDSEAVIRAVHPGPLEPPATAEAAREHFRRLRTGLLAWMDGSAKPQGLPAHAQFTAGIVALLDRGREQHASGNVLAVSSGGPISVALGHVLGLGREAVIELNLHLRNSAVSEVRVTPGRLSLVTFNSLTHLDAAEHRGWVTHA
jgi:broad specificity phosphatase PhoE